VAAPSIRRIARDLGIDLTRVSGSATGGRIVIEDLRAYIQHLQEIAFASPAPEGVAASAPKPAESIDFSKWGPVRRQALTTLRKTISRRMLESANSIPHVTQFDEADVTDLMELRRKLAPSYESKGAKLTLTPLILKAVAATLGKYPIFNASIDDAADEVVYKDYVHIGIAVDTEAGLIVPVIRDVNRKTVLDLSKELADLAVRARDRKVGLDELKGGSFTISNQGGIGGGHFTPIVNKPEVAILGLGRSALKPVVKGDAIVPRTLMPLALSYDHRLIDGALADMFTGRIKQLLENWTDSVL